LISGGMVSRDEILIATKGGFIPYDHVPPRDEHAYFEQTFVMPGIITPNDVVADCHCMAPAYLKHQLEFQSHEPQAFLPGCLLSAQSRNAAQSHPLPAEFMTQMRAAFEVLEDAASQGKLRMYGTATWDGYRARIGSRGHLSLEALVGLAREVGGKDHHFKVIQLPYNLGMLEALAEQTQTLNGSKVSVLEAAKALDLYVMASASILQGQLSRELPSEVREALGEGTDAQRSIQFVRSTPGVGTALIGMKQAEHVRDNLAVAARAPLVPTQFAKLFK
jgi:aryl-alcohol dehydrogenase-like predicted oxidoreductase